MAGNFQPNRKAARLVLHELFNRFGSDASSIERQYLMQLFCPFVIGFPRDIIEGFTLTPELVPSLYVNTSYNNCIKLISSITIRTKFSESTRKVKFLVNLISIQTF